VPGAGNSQAWNRFAYVSNNPILNSDPSGHMTCNKVVNNSGPISDEDCSDYATDYGNGSPVNKYRIFLKNQQLAQQVADGEINDLEAFAQLSDYAAGLTPTCASCYVANIGSIITGQSSGNYAVNEILIYFGMKVHDKYYDDAVSSNQNFNQTGYDPAFQDPVELEDNNQARHYWFYVQVAYESGSAIGYAGVVAHETFLGRSLGKSLQDLYLGYEGVKLGVMLRDGNITPLEVGGHIRTNLSPGSDTAKNYQQYIDQLRSGFPIWVPRPYP
jgi:hypothetical protein